MGIRRCLELRILAGATLRHGQRYRQRKVRIAFELARRPLLAAALADGRLSYSKVRVITRIINTTEETDRVLIHTGTQTSAADLVHVVEHYKKLLDQDRPPKDRPDRQGVRCIRRFDGLSVLELILPTDAEARVLAILDAEVSRRRAATNTATGAAAPVDKAPAGAKLIGVGEPVDKAPAGADNSDRDGEPVDEAPAGAEPEIDPLRPHSWNHQRADALVDLLEAGYAALCEHADIDTNRAVVEVVVDYDTLIENADTPAALGNGVPLTGDAARRLACDAGICRIITRGPSEILDQGRMQRQWNQAQRRAIRYRHGGRCAFPACHRLILTIHHSQPWANHGPTNLTAGIPLCSGHHHLCHEGRWTATYNPQTHTTTFHGPAGQTITTPPRQPRPTLAA